MALVLEEVVVRDQLMQQLQLLDLAQEVDEEVLLEGLRAKGASDRHYRSLCAELAVEFAAWVEFLAGNERPVPVHIADDSPEAWVKDMIPLLEKEANRSMVKRLGLDQQVPLEGFKQKAELLGYLLGELLACRQEASKLIQMQNPSVTSKDTGESPEEQYGALIQQALAVLNILDDCQNGESALRAIEHKIKEILDVVPKGYNDPLFDISILSPEQSEKLEKINNDFKQDYKGRQSMIIDRFNQTLAALFRVKGVPSELKEGLQSCITEELRKYKRSHPCDFSVLDIALAREDIVLQQEEKTNVRAAIETRDQPRMKTFVANMEVYRRGSGAKATNKKEDLPKKSRRRRKWEADDADSLPTNADIEGEDGDAEEKEGEPQPHEEDYDEGETKEEKEERRRQANEQREAGEKRKADEIIKKKSEEPKKLSKQERQFLKQQLQKEKRQQRREKKLEKTRRGNIQNQKREEPEE